MNKKTKDILSNLPMVDHAEVSEKGCSKSLPSEFFNTKNGLYYSNGKNTFRLTYGPLIPVARGIGADRQSYPQLTLAGLNTHQQYVSFTFDMSKVDQASVARVLSAKGISVCSGSFKHLESFLMACHSMNLPTTLLVKSSGYVEGQYAFVHGASKYYSGDLKDGFSSIDLVDSQQLPASIRRSGCYEKWYQGVEASVNGSPQIFALIASFASYFQSLMSKENYIVHFYGRSTTGKTSTLQLAASVHGFAGEPGDITGSMLGSWNTTANGVESHLVNHSGTLLLLDEIGSYKGRELDSLIYNMAMGKSKMRMSKTLGQQEQKTWTGCILSSGELSISEKLAEHGGQLSEGQQHRAISLEMLPDDGARDGESMEDIRSRAEALKVLVTEHYGVAIHELLERLTKHDYLKGEERSYEQLAQHFVISTKEIEKKLLPALEARGVRFSPAQRRALHRFAYIGAWGEFLASDSMMKMIPFTAERTYETVFQMALRWLKDDENKYSPEKRVLIELYKQLQQKQHSNFYEKGDEYLPHQFWGMRKSGSFFILDSVFEDWCRRHNVKSFKVAKLLVDAGYLAKEGAGHYKKRITIDGNKYSMFQLSENFLEADVDKL